MAHFERLEDEVTSVSSQTEIEAASVQIASLNAGNAKAAQALTQARDTITELQTANDQRTGASSCARHHGSW